MTASEARPRRRTLGEWIAIGGSVLAASSIVLVAAAFLSAMSASRGPTSSFDWSSLVPALAVAGVYVALAYGFARRSRIAYVVGLLLSLWTLTGMTWVLVSDARFGATVIPYAIGLPALLMGVGLGMAWRPFWQRSRGAEPNNR